MRKITEGEGKMYALLPYLPGCGDKVAFEITEKRSSTRQQRPSAEAAQTAAVAAAPIVGAAEARAAGPASLASLATINLVMMLDFRVDFVTLTAVDLAPAPHPDSSTVYEKKQRVNTTYRYTRLYNSIPT